MAETARHTEEYASSLSTYRRMGAVAARGAELDYSHGDVVEAFEDFSSALGENLATDTEFDESLVFTPMRLYEIRGGQVVTANGQIVANLVANGLKASQQAAETDPEMHIQTVRDEGDVMVAREADSLEVGQLYAVVSLDPKKALDRNRAYWEGKGYRKGMAVLQVYYRVSETEMLAGAYSIKQSDKAVLAKIFGGYGTHIPLTETDNRWIRHGIKLDCVDREEAEEFGKALTREHAREIGSSEAKVSVTDLIRDNHSLVRACFDNYIRAIGESLATGSLDSELKSLAGSLLQNGANYSSSDTAGLMRLANGVFQDKDMAIIEEKVRYGLVEELRKLIPAYLNRTNSYSAAGYYIQPVHSVYRVEQALFMQDMSRMMAGNVAGGMTAGRSYGGCASAGGSDLQLGSGSPFGAESQDTFGGKAAEDKGDCEFISKSCPKCGEKNVRTKVTKTHISGSCGCRVKK